MMDWVNRMQAALDYIEANLTNDLSVEQVAAVTNTSSFHFQRMFAMLCDVTVAEYVRRRRLTMAAKDLLTTGDGITDIAARYGYETQASFTRAYVRLHGVSPGKTRSMANGIAAYPPLRFTLSIKGDRAVDYRVEKKPGFRLIGKEWRVSTRDGENFRVIPGYWDQTVKDGTLAALMEHAKADGLFRGSCLGIATDVDFAAETLTYIIGVESDSTDLLERWVGRSFEPATYAVFAGEGKDGSAIQGTIKRVFQEWFPATSYEHTSGPEVEVYLDQTHHEFWVPVKTA